VRLVLDTSVLVSAQRSRRGASALLMEAAFQRRFEVLLSVPLLLEYENVLKRDEHLRAGQTTTERVDRLLTDLTQVAINIARIGEPLRLPLPDASDEHVLRLAVRANADAVVTQNIRHFAVPAKSLGVHCCLPGEAVRRLGEV
jgi:putative PIN family toxin of toxin-antitoxin system